MDSILMNKISNLFGPNYERGSTVLNSLVVYFDPSDGGYRLWINDAISPYVLDVRLVTGAKPGELVVALKKSGEVQQ